MRDMVAEARAEHHDRMDTHQEYRHPRDPHTIHEKMGNTIVDQLMLLCGVTNDNALPAVYHEWAARPRGLSEGWVMQNAMDAYCSSQGMPPFEFTPTQIIAFKNFRFAGSSYFDIGSGLLTFSITPADATSPAARAMLAADRGRVDAFDLGDDPESGVIAPSDVS
jgi:hypothetical protein